MTTFERVLNPGSGESKYIGNVFISVKFAEGRLSITGVEGPMRNGDCRGGCGQIVNFELKTYSDGWTPEMVERLREIWNRWHLNDMFAGSPAQAAYLRAHPIEYKYPESHYEKACAALAAVGLNPDPNHERNGKPYAYGSAWLYEEVPADVLEELQSLPESKLVPAWV